MTTPAHLTSPQSSGYTDPVEQAWMVLDLVRTQAYANAIEDAVHTLQKKLGRPPVVVDIGSGSGILALLAYKAGASVVYAIERSGMFRMLCQHIEQNQAQHAVFPIKKDAMALSTTDFAHGKPDLIISEMLGHFAADEDQERLFTYIATLSQEHVETIPKNYQNLFYLAEIPALTASMQMLLTEIPQKMGVSLTQLANTLPHRARLERIDTSDICARLENTESYRPTDAHPTTIRLQLPVERNAQCNALVVCWHALLWEGQGIHQLRTDPASAPTHWLPVVLPLWPPLSVEQNDIVEIALHPRLVTDRGSWLWGAKNLRTSEVRQGDAMRALVGDKTDMLADLGIALKQK